MARLVRFDPFNDIAAMRDMMERLYEESVARSRGLLRGGMDGRAWIPVDMYETEDHYVLRAALPGVKAEDIDISVTGEVLTIKGQTKRGVETEGMQGTYSLHEMRDTCYYRQIDLPAHIDADKSNASFEHGILVLRMPKAEEARPKRIPIGKTDAIGEKIGEVAHKIGLS